MSYVASALATSPDTNSNTSLSVTKPTGTAVGDVIVLWLTLQNSSTPTGITGPSGFSPISGSPTTETTSPRSTGACWTRLVDGTEGASLATSWTNGGNAILAASTYRGVDYAGITSAIGQQVLSSTSRPSPTLVTTVGGWIVTGWGDRNGSTWTHPDTMRRTGQLSSDVSLLLGDSNADVSAGTINRTATASEATTTGVTFIMNLPPASITTTGEMAVDVALTGTASTIGVGTTTGELAVDVALAGTATTHSGALGALPVDVTLTAVASGGDLPPAHPVGVYTADEVMAELLFATGTRTMTFRFDQYSSSNVLMGPLYSVLSASISNNMLADIKRTAQFSLEDGTEAIDYLKDRIKPYACLTMPDGGTVEWPLGMFLLTSPIRQYRNGTTVTRDVEGYDQLSLLSEDATEIRYTVATGALVTATIEAIVGDEGLTSNITPSTKTIPGAMEWEPGTSWLRIINDLLSAINYNSARFDEDGMFIADPYVSPAVRSSDHTYATDDMSVIVGDVSQTLDLFGVPNKWILVKSEPDQPALVGTYTNSNPASPTSTVSRGRTITVVDSETEAVDQATLDELAARRAFEASQVFEVIEFETAIMPFHNNADVITLTIDDLGVGAKYSEHEWSMSLEPGGAMKHKVRRVVNV